jgi:hypothetical protein
VAHAELAYLQAIELLEKHPTRMNPELITVMRDYIALIRQNRNAEVRAIERRIKAIQSLKPSEQ